MGIRWTRVFSRLATVCAIACVPLPSHSSPAEVDSPATGAARFEDFIGAQRCGECHAQQYRTWQKSTHGRAGGAPSADIVISRFEGTVLHFSDATVTLQVDAQQRYLYHVQQPGHESQTFEVAGFVGGGHMLGGGTQSSFARFSDGTWRLLPFDYSPHGDRWFCDTRDGNGWQPITPQLSLEACRYWPPVANFVPNCGNCHSSQLQSSFAAGNNMERVRFMSLAINCESCHGPGRRHESLMRRADRSSLADIGLVPLSLLDKQGSVEVCFRCHALTQKLAPNYLPGKPLEDYYALNYYPGGRRYPDGRVKGFGYQEGHLYSDCFLSGAMTCVDCHEPHSLAYRDVNRVALNGKLDDGQCTACHPAKRQDVRRHTGHAEGSPGSRCLVCHMPFLQHASVGSDVRFSRADHTIPIPRPELDASLGLATACDACHPARSAAWQQEQVVRWHGATKPHHPAVAMVFALQRKGGSALALKALAEDHANHRGAQLDILRLAGRILGLPSTAPSLPLRELIDQQARGVAIDAAALASAWSRAAAAPVAPTSDVGESRLRRVALWLQLQGEEALEGGRLLVATDLLEKSLASNPHAIRARIHLADLYGAAGQPREALNTLRAAAAGDLTAAAEYRLLLGSMCKTLGDLVADGMPRSEAIVRLCTEPQARPEPVP